MTKLFLGIRWGSWGRKIRWPSRYTINLGRSLRINLPSSRSVLNFIDGAFEKEWSFVVFGNFRI